MSDDMWDIVPQKFYRGIKSPKASNVGQLIKKLKKLPKDLPIRQGFGRGVALTVYNIESDPFLEFLDITDLDWYQPQEVGDE